MRHNSVVSSHLKSTGILWVDGLSTGPLDLRRHKRWEYGLGQVDKPTFFEGRG